MLNTFRGNRGTMKMSHGLQNLFNIAANRWKWWKWTYKDQDSIWLTDDDGSIDVNMSWWKCWWFQDRIFYYLVEEKIFSHYILVIRYILGISGRCSENILVLVLFDTMLFVVLVVDEYVDRPTFINCARIIDFSRNLVHCSFIVHWSFIQLCCERIKICEPFHFIRFGFVRLTVLFTSRIFGNIQKKVASLIVTRASRILEFSKSSMLRNKYLHSIL